MSTKRNLVNETIENLTNLIIREKYQEGQKLPIEGELAKSLNIGRSTLREAVKILAFSNVLEVKQGSGTYIKNAKVTIKNSSDDILVARSMIECEAVRLVIENDYDLKEMLYLKEILFKRDVLLQQGKFSEFVDIDEEFHLTIVKLAKNPILIRWYYELLPDIKVYQSTKILNTTSYSDNSILHNNLYEAIISKNYEKAVNAIKENNSVT